MAFTLILCRVVKATEDHSEVFRVAPQVPRLVGNPATKIPRRRHFGVNKHQCWLCPGFYLNAGQRFLLTSETALVSFCNRWGLLPDSCRAV